MHRVSYKKQLYYILNTSKKALNNWIWEREKRENIYEISNIVLIRFCMLKPVRVWFVWIFYPFIPCQKQWRFHIVISLAWAIGAGGYHGGFPLSLWFSEMCDRLYLTISLMKLDWVLVYWMLSCSGFDLKIKHFLGIAIKRYSVLCLNIYVLLFFCVIFVLRKNLVTFHELHNLKEWDHS